MYINRIHAIGKDAMFVAHDICNAADIVVGQKNMKNCRVVS